MAKLKAIPARRTMTSPPLSWLASVGTLPARRLASGRLAASWHLAGERRMAFSVVASSFGAAELGALRDRTSEPGPNPLLNHGALELGKDAHHLKHRLAGRCRRPPFR